jgi:integrase
MKDANAGIRQKDRAYTHEEIQTILQYAASPKVRAIILLLASSGIRVGAVQSIKIKHLTHIPAYTCYQLLIYPGSNDEYITFCTPEAAAAIDSYLAYRSRAGEKLTDQSFDLLKCMVCLGQLQLAGPIMVNQQFSSFFVLVKYETYNTKIEHLP